MAQNDIIDLDEIIANQASRQTSRFVNSPDLFKAFTRSQAIYPTVDMQEDRDFEINKLKQYGFDPTL